MRAAWRGLVMGATALALGLAMAPVCAQTTEPAAESEAAAPATPVDPADLPPDIRQPTADETAEMDALDERMRDLLSTFRPKLAEFEARALLALQEETWGPDHPVTGGTHQFLRIIYAVYRHEFESNQRRLGADHPLTRASLDNLAAMLDDIGRRDEADPLLRRALEARERVVRRPDFLAAMRNDTICRRDEADPLLRRAPEARERVHLPELPDTYPVFEPVELFPEQTYDHDLTRVENLTALYKSQGRYGDAEPLAAQPPSIAAIIEQLSKSSAEKAQLFRALGRIGSRDGEAQLPVEEQPPLPTYQESSAQYFRRSMKGKEVYLGPQHPETLADVAELGRIYREQGRYTEAELLLRRALVAREMVLGPEHPDTVTSIAALAQLYLEQGRYGEAEPLYKRALGERERLLGPGHPDTLTSVDNLATLYWKQGRYAEAERASRHALEERERVLGPEHLQTLHSVSNLATLLFNLDRYDEAERLHRRALEASERSRSVFYRQDIPLILNNLGVVYKAQGRYTEAEPLYKRALKVSESVLGPEHLQTLYIVNNLAAVYEAQGRYTEAEPLYQRALGERERVLGPGHPDTLISLNNLAALHVNQGRYGEAETLLLRALRRSQARAVREMQSAAGRRPRQLALDDTQSARRTIFSLARKDPSRAGLAAEAAIMLKALGGTFHAALRRASQDLPPKDRHLVEELRAAVAQRDAAAAGGETEEAKTSAEYVDRLERELAAKSPDFAAALMPVGWQEVAHALPEGATLIEYVVFAPIDFATRKAENPRVLAAVLTLNAQPEVVDLGPLAALDEYLRATLDPRRPEHAAILPKARIALYQKLVEPLGARVTQAKQVIIAPDDALHRVPFALLRPSREVQYWIEAQDVRIVPTGRVLRPRDRSNPAPHAVVFGGPDYGFVPKHCPILKNQVASAATVAEAARSATASDGFCPLPHTREEAIEVADLLRDKGLPVEPPYLGDAASEAALRALLEAPRVLHLATHGKDTEADYAAEPLARALLALAGANNSGGKPENDGLLFGTDVALLPLQGTELVTLSACDTAHGAIEQGEGVMSLAHGFRLAGAQNVLMTLWTIDDDKARAFMKSFYSTWLRNEAAGPGAALRAVQREWIERNERPEHWAAYVLVED